MNYEMFSEHMKPAGVSMMMYQQVCLKPKWGLTIMAISQADDAGLEGGIFGNPVIRTPHLDELGRKSVRFTRAFTPVSSCSPSNVSSRFIVSIIDQPWPVYDPPGIIGKKHVGPNGVFPFDFAHTEENSPINQVGRNITHMKNLVGSFLDRFGDKPFFLYIPFHDPHRCGHTNPELGEFCQKFGDSVSGFGTIPDWEPTYYSDEEVIVPGTVPDTRATRSEIANQYTTISRLDQGIGLIMDELTARGHINETLVIYSSDNGIPFPNGRTNFYDLGIHQPLLISSPVHPRSHGQSVASLVSLLDVTPTVLDWFRIPYPRYKMFHHSPSVRLTGKSLLPALDYMSGGQTDLMHQERTVVFGSHNLHEVTMYYPMRYIRGPRFKLIRNLAHESYFPIDQDFFLSKSLQVRCGQGL
eukprot:TCALIF_10750-PB protein Name:"Similar to SGSH N-sulphoglucosamine sulphohydrolase (Homo sapiens)" AED:0.39 eAED:0.45 QI:0/0.5/0.28/1/0.5/0.42/7/0/411